METETPLMLAMFGCVALLTYLALTKTICFRYSFPAIDDAIDYDIQQRLQRTAAKVVHILTLQHSEKAMAHHQIVGRRYGRMHGCLDRSPTDDRFSSYVGWFCYDVKHSVISLCIRIYIVVRGEVGGVGLNVTLLFICSL